MAKTRNISQLNPDFSKMAGEIKAQINKKLPILVGQMHVDGFKDSFDKQGFNDDGAAQWQEVKRRIPGNNWYGFQYGASSKGKKNFSASATTRSILLGFGSVGLRESIFLKQASRGRIVIASPLPYAQLHNEGGTMRIFGKTSGTMPKRQFMGNSSKLNRRAKLIITKRINNIMK